MTAVLDAPVATEAETDAPPPRRSPGPRLRADLRLARRAVWRAKGASALVAALVALPMALLSGGAVFWTGHLPTTQERITAELGQADAWAAIVGGADPSRRQFLDTPLWAEVERTTDSNEPAHPVLPAPASPVPFLPAGTTTIEIGEGSVVAETAGGLGTIAAVIGDAWDPALRGAYELQAGRVPRSDREAMVSPGALERLGARIGDELTLTEPAAPFTITGVLTQASRPDAFQQVFLPGTAGMRALQTDPSATRWFAPAWDPSADDVYALNREGIVVFSRTLVADPGAGAAPPAYDGGATWWLAGGIAAVATFCAYLVVLLAGAAFSVSTRRQQRMLAVAASVGAGRGDVFRVVLLQGTVLGLIGGVVGAACGIALGAALLHAFDDGSTVSFWGVHVPWAGIAAIVLFSVAVGTLVALVPARAATHGDTMAALRGARTPVRVRVARPLWGSLLLAVGVAVSVAGALVLAWIGPTIDNLDPPLQLKGALRMASVVALIAGPLLVQIGVIVAGHWLLWLASRVLSTLGMAPRLASRDAAAHPARIVPAFGAVAAVAFLAAVALGAVSVTMGITARSWYYTAPLGSAWVSLDRDGVGTDAQLAEAEGLVQTLLDRMAPAATALVRSQAWPSRDMETSELLELDAVRVSPTMQRFLDCEDAAEGRPCETEASARFSYASELAVIAPDELSTALGLAVSPADAATVRDGGALVTSEAWLTSAGDVELNGFTAEQEDSYWETDADPMWTESIPARLVVPPHDLSFQVVISPATAEWLGVRATAVEGIAAFDAAPSQFVVDSLAQETQAAQRTLPQGLWAGSGRESGPPDPALWIWLILCVTSVLVIGASGVALGLARVERRPDDATLAAVGAGRGIRRGIAFWQAIIIAGIGTVVGVVAGTLPVWAVVVASSGERVPPAMDDIPWLALALVCIGLPIAIALVSWLVPPRHPDLTRRTAIA